MTKHTKKRGARDLVTKGAGFALIVVALQFWYTLVFGGYQPPLYLDKFLAKVVQESPDIVFLGDSSVFSSADSEDARSTADMLDDLLP